MNMCWMVLAILSGLFFSETSFAAETPYWLQELSSPSCQPRSSYLTDATTGLPYDFCATWNPEFFARGEQCCALLPPKKKRKRRGHWCAPNRGKAAYCDEMTDEQRSYTDDVENDRLGDVLDFLKQSLARGSEQAYCSVNNGFLAQGRRLVPTEVNRIAIRSPRCVDFGTDGMVAMLEWLGREVAAKYSDHVYKGVRLVVGDISAPKGGCLVGRGGRQGHSSHTNGLDADLGFLLAKPGVKSPIELHKTFDVKTNWWLIQRILQNPFVCVKVIFLDRKLIALLGKTIGSDPLWAKFRPFLRHVRGHRNHYHIRVGIFAGAPGCLAPEPTDSDFEEEEVTLEDDAEEGEGASSLENSTSPSTEAEKDTSESSKIENSENKKQEPPK